MIVIAVIALASVFSLAACNKENPQDGGTVDVHIVIPDGAPALSLAKLLQEKPQYEGYNITYQIVAGATEVSTAFANGTATLAIAPTNIAANLYNKTGAKLITVNLHGVLYLVGTEGAASLSDLVGKVVYNIGRGGTPDLTFKYILAENGLSYTESEEPVAGKVALHYVSSGSELVPLLKQGKAKYGILGEPAVTQSKNAAGTTVLFDIQAEWEKVTDNAAYPQAGLIGQSSFLTDKNAAFIDWLVEKMKENDQWIIDNASSVGAILTANGSALNLNFNAAIIENCNIDTVKANLIKGDVTAYLTVIHSFSAQAVGGSVPDGNFYYYK